MTPLARDFYDRGTIDVARELIGKLIVRRSRNGLATARIVETEAYLGQTDPACHSYRGVTRRNATMFGSPGHLYVYSIHARWCMNAVTQPRGIGDAVLIRAAEPVSGIDLMQRRRERQKDVDLTRGPARLCHALDVDGNLDGHDLTRGQRIWFCDSNDADDPAMTVGVTPRIGISTNIDAQLRFFFVDNRFVSGTKRLNQSGKRVGTNKK